MVNGGLMVTRELAWSIHGSIATRWHRMLLLAVRRDMLLRLLVLMAGTSSGASAHVVRMVMVMMRNWIAWSKIQLWCCHARLAGSWWCMHSLMMHMIGMRRRRCC